MKKIYRAVKPPLTEQQRELLAKVYPLGVRAYDANTPRPAKSRAFTRSTP